MLHIHGFVHCGLQAMRLAGRRDVMLRLVSGDGVAVLES